jgi:hypothetical protein
VVQTTIIPGISGNARHFGKGDYILIAQDTDFAFPEGNIVVEFWFRPDTIRHSAIFFKGDALGSFPWNHDWAIVLEPDSSLRWHLNNDVEVRTASSTIASGVWYHIVASVFKAVTGVSTLRIDVNGMSAASGVSSDPNLLVNSYPLYIGYAGMGGDPISQEAPLLGSVDEVKIFNPPVHRLPFEYVNDSSTVGLWHMNEFIGTGAMDASTYGNKGTATGTSIAVGRFGNARNLPGSGHSIVINDSPSLRQNQISVEAWVYSTQYDGMPWGIIASKELTSSSFSYRLQMAGSTRHVYFATGINQNAGITSTVQLDNGKWYHIAGTFDGTNLSVYLNGVLAGIKVQSGTISYNSDVLYFGRDIDNVGVWKGLLDEVRISNRPRTPSEFNLQLPPQELSGSAIANNAQLTWRNGGGGVGLLRYRVYMGSDSISMSVIDSTILPEYTKTALLQNTTYFFRASSVDSSGFESTWSHAFAATTSALPVGAPALVYPAQRALLGATVVPFVWNKATNNPTGYMFHIATDSSFTFQSVDTSLTDTTKIVLGLSAGQKYWWKVRAKNSNGWGGYSETRTFDISLTNVPDPTALPESFILSQNYPNPFNPSTYIPYGLKYGTHVILSIFDALGQEVGRLVNEEQDAGYHEVKFDGSNLASGVYFYRLQADTYVETKRLLLLR